MKTIEIEIALMNYIGIRQNIVVPNVHWGMDFMHECDILSLTSSGYATEIEIKISKSNLLKDKEKKHGHNHKLITYLYFAVPENLIDIAFNEIPERSGLYRIYKRNNSCFVKLIKPAKRKSKPYKWPIEKRLKLAHLGTMRILGLKKKLAK